MPPVERVVDISPANTSIGVLKFIPPIASIVSMATVTE